MVPARCRLSFYGLGAGLVACEGSLGCTCSSSRGAKCKRSREGSLTLPPCLAPLGLGVDTLVAVTGAVVAASVASSACKAASDSVVADRSIPSAMATVTSLTAAVVAHGGTTADSTPWHSNLATVAGGSGCEATMTDSLSVARAITKEACVAGLTCRQCAAATAVASTAPLGASLVYGR